jgi:hypothetical protein
MVKAFGSFVLLLTAGCGALAAGFGDWNPPADDEYFPEHQFRRNGKSVSPSKASRVHRFVAPPLTSSILNHFTISIF